MNLFIKIIQYLSVVLIFVHQGFTQESIPDKTEMCKVLSQMIQNDKDIRSKIPDGFNPDKHGYSEKEIDSLKLIRNKIDDYNTQELIRLTKKYGWISSERINCKNLETWLIFRHSDPKYFKEIKALIEKEHQANRLSNWHYKLIMNHIEGRPH